MKRSITFESLGLLILLAVLVVVIWIVYPPFISSVNIINIILTVSVFGVMAVPWAMLCLGGELDISIGSMAGFTAVVAASFIKAGIPSVPSMLLSLVIAGFIGLINGLLVTRIGINSIITTLGMYSILRGAAFVITNGRGIIIIDKVFKFLGIGRIGPIPFSVILFVLFFIAGFVVLKYTRFGRNIYVTGGNKKAAVISGIKVNRIKTLLYVLAAVGGGVGGLIVAAQLSNALPKIGMGYEFVVITAVVLGGVSLGGGKGTLTGVLLGTLIIGTIRYGLQITGVHSFYQIIAEGLILLIAVSLDRLNLTRRKAA